MTGDGGSVEEYRKLLNRIGAETVITEYMDAVTIDFYPMLTKIKNSEADSILVTTDIPGVSKLLQQHKELGLTQKVMSTGGSNWTDAIIRIAGAEAADGSYHDLIFAGFAPESAPNPIEAKAFVKEWKKRKLNWDGLVEGARGYDAIYTIAEAIRLAKGSGERAKIRKALEAVDIKGITAHIKWDAFHDAKPNVLLVQIKDGKSAIFNCE
jgi:branched-chain amino acid transport system substrate-binding protein